MLWMIVLALHTAADTIVYRWSRYSVPDMQEVIVSASHGDEIVLPGCWDWGGKGYDLAITKSITMRGSESSWGRVGSAWPRISLRVYSNSVTSIVFKHLSFEDTVVNFLGRAYLYSRFRPSPRVVQLYHRPPGRDIGISHTKQLRLGNSGNSSLLNVASIEQDRYAPTPVSAPIDPLKHSVVVAGHVPR